MRKLYLSNTLLVVGVFLLGCFAVLEAAGVHSDPIVPAFSAFFIGCTAVLDRVGVPALK
jgi:hypothetical protein